MYYEVNESSESVVNSIEVCQNENRAGCCLQNKMLFVSAKNYADLLGILTISVVKAVAFLFVLVAFFYVFCSRHICHYYLI